MGYTNRIKYRNPTSDEAQAIIADIKELISNSGAAITVSEVPGQITFDGRSPHGSQPFKWPSTPVPQGDEHPNGDLHVQYCKTNRRKYDMVVLAALLTIKHHMPDVEIGTDDCMSLEGLQWALHNASYAEDCKNVLALLRKMKFNEFSKMHQSGSALYLKTFPERDLAEVIPWSPLTKK